MPLPASLLLALLLSALPLARSTNAAGLKFLSDNALEDGVVVLPSGLQYKVLTPGSGLETPFSNTTCLLHYTGTLADGTEFDSSYKRGKVRCAAPFSSRSVTLPAQPSVVEPQSMTKGFHEALLLMTEGSKLKMCRLAPPARLFF
jgi:FKBP-type peptidyl-prolyl cis-trans isomerase